MKKLITVFLAAVITLTLAACANEQQNSDVSNNTQSESPDSTSTQSLDPASSTDPGENDTAIFAATEGTWRLDGEEGTASIYMDGTGGFISYYASGSVEASGYLEYVDEYGDGNGRYDLYDGELGLINSFYFDSDTQIHMGNNNGNIYIKEGPEADITPEIGVLVPKTRFTGLAQIENNNDFHGGYYYADRTEDGFTTIINSGFTNDFSAADETIEEYIGRCVDLIGEFEYRDLEIEEATLDSWPAYYLTWLEGENEDTRQWDALLVTTDLYTYIYAFDTKADYAEEMLDTWYEVLDGLTLDFPSE